MHQAHRTWFRHKSEMRHIINNYNIWHSRFEKPGVTVLWFFCASMNEFYSPFSYTDEVEAKAMKCRLAGCSDEEPVLWYGQNERNVGWKFISNLRESQWKCIVRKRVYVRCGFACFALQHIFTLFFAPLTEENRHQLWPFDATASGQYWLGMENLLDMSQEKCGTRWITHSPHIAYIILTGISSNLKMIPPILGCVWVVSKTR